MYHAIVRRRIEALFTAMNAGDPRPIIDGFTPAGEHLFIGNHARAGRRHGREAIAASVNRICAALPGAGATNELVAVKTDGIETAEMLIAAGVARRAAYMHRSWVALPLGAPPDELRHRICASYDLIRGALPKKLRAALAARD